METIPGQACMQSQACTTSCIAAWAIWSIIRAPSHAAPKWYAWSLMVSAFPCGSGTTSRTTPLKGRAPYYSDGGALVDPKDLSDLSWAMEMECGALVRRELREANPDITEQQVQPHLHDLEKCPEYIFRDVHGCFLSGRSSSCRAWSWRLANATRSCHW